MGKIMRRLARAVAATVTGAVLWGTAPVAQADSGNAIGALAGVLTGAAMYNVYVSELLSSGNSAGNQAGLWNYDAEKNGVDKNPNDYLLVDRVMRRLVERGRYEKDIRALPFRWQVNDSKEFNASCYLTDYVSVNRGLVWGLNRNEDEIAAVLGHEMTHGTDMHVAFSTAKKMALMAGAMVANISTGAHIPPDALSMLVMGGSAQNFELPHEYAADEGGFFIMASAGFNPGGPAAAMVVMQRIAEQEKLNDIMHDPDAPGYELLQNHPDTDKREKKLADMMTAYSCGHVKVLEGKGVAIDGALLLEAGYTDDSYDNSAENAYLIAGALAKAFHDCPTLEDWNFRPGENGRYDFLTDDRVYAVLKQAVEQNKADARLYDFVRSAYVREQDGRLRQELAAFEAKREAHLEETRRKNLETDLKNVEQLYKNADVYNDLFLPKYAIEEAERIFSCPEHEKQVPGFFAVRGRARALQGNYAGALEDCNHAIELKPEGEAFLYLNRAEVYRLQGMPQEALADCALAEAQATEQERYPVYKMQGDIYAECGEREAARERYQKLLEINPKTTDIPLPYLDELAPKNAEAVRKQIIEDVKKELGESFKTPEEREKEKKEQEKKAEKERRAKEKEEKKAKKG